MCLGISQRPFDVDRGELSWTLGCERIGDEAFFSVRTGRFQLAGTVCRTKPPIASSCDGPEERGSCDRSRMGTARVLDGLDTGA